MDKVTNMVKLGVEKPFQILEDGMVVMGKKIYLPEDKALKEKVLREAHELRFTIHLGSTKMKKEIIEFVAKIEFSNKQR